MERRGREGETPVDVGASRESRILSRAGHEESCLNYPRPRGKAKYERDTDSDEYREGKVKSTPSRGMKESLKPCAYNRSEPHSGVTACLLHNEPTSCSCTARLSTWRYGAEAKASLKRAREVVRGRRETL